MNVPRGTRGRFAHPARDRYPHEMTDPATVQRLVDGDRQLRAAPAELDLAIDRLDHTGMTAREIADRIGTTRRTVARRRATRRTNQPPAPE